MSTQTLPPPPLVSGLPILGNTLDMANDIIGFCVTQYKRVGPIFRLRALNQEMVVLAGPEANIFITQEGADKFRSYESWAPLGMELGTDTYLQSVDGELHTQLRKVMKRGYSAGMMLSNLPLLVDIAQTALNQLPVGTELSALQLFRLIVTEQLGQMLTNRPVGDDLSAISDYISAALKVRVLKTNPAFMLRLPGYKRAKQRMIDLGNEIIADHRTNTRAQPDLIDDIMAAREKTPGLFDTDAQMIQAVIGPFIAGLDTASNECAFLLYALSNHPDILRQCIDEADALFANGVPLPEQLRSLDVIHHAMMETLRMYSIGLGVTRTAAKPFTFAGHQVEEGQSLFLASTVSHFLPEFFKNPTQFDISRYTPPRNEHKQRGAFSPFGIGTHTCLGAGAAEFQIMLAIATVLHLIRLEPLHNGKTLKITNDPTPTLGNRFRVRIAERRHQIAVDRNAQPLKVDATTDELESV